MIVTVTLNAALDITYELRQVTVGGTNRVARVHERPGGKGLNVARVLHALGEPVRARGLLGGRTGDVIEAGLRASGVDGTFTRIRAESRRTVALAEPDRATLLNEPGPHVTPEEWALFVTDFRTALAAHRTDAVVLSGSLPPGVPVDAYATLAEICRHAEVAVILDADGAALQAGLAGRPDIVKPNADELARLGVPPDATPAFATQAVRDAGAAAVVVSRGREGLLASTPDGTWTAVPPPIRGNPTGAGDALVAVLAQGLAHGWTWPDRLRHGAALSAAAVRTDVAGSYDPATYRELLPQIRLDRA